GSASNSRRAASRAARTAGASIMRSARISVSFWSCVAMGFTTLTSLYLFSGHLSGVCFCASKPESGERFHQRPHWARDAIPLAVRAGHRFHLPRHHRRHIHQLDVAAVILARIEQRAALAARQHAVQPHLIAGFTQALEALVVIDANHHVMEAGALLVELILEH